jgi:hypothetical protein
MSHPDRALPLIGGISARPAGVQWTEEWQHGVAAWAGVRLRLHPDKTKVVDLREGREGLDFLGCHFRARM